MDDLIQILSNQWYITISTYNITWVCCELNGLSREHLKNSHVNLNKVGPHDKMSSMQKKWHWRYYINFLISEYLSYNQQNTLAIDGMKISSMVFIDFESKYLKYLKSLQYEQKSELRISNEMWKYVFRSDPESDQIYFTFSFSVTYMVYILFLIVCGNYPLTSKRRRCRNLL